MPDDDCELDWTLTVVVLGALVDPLLSVTLIDIGNAFELAEPVEEYW